MKIRYLKKKKRSILASAAIVAAFFILVPNKSLAREVTVGRGDFTTYFTTTGDAKTWDGEKVILTEDTNDQVGGFYLNKRIDTVGSFTLKGEVYLGSKLDSQDGADGMSFIFHPNNQNMLGRSGGTLGMLGIPNLTGFRLDTFYNVADSSKGEPADWPNMNGSAWFDQKPKHGHANTPFGGFATTNGNGQVSYDYSSNQKLDKQLFLNNNVGPQPITVSYDAYEHRLSISLSNLIWSRKINYSDEASLAFQVQAATGANHNLQYFVFDSFTFNEDRQITVKEVWDHTGNDGEQPTGGYTLLKDDTQIGDPYVTAAGTEVTSYTSDDLDDNGNYSIKALDVDNYKVVSVEQDKNDPDSYIITRKYNPNETKITVNEIWKDDEDSYGLRPETSSFQMMANGTVLDETYHNSTGNNWAQEITLPERDKDGVGDPIKYSVKAEAVPDYETSVNDNKDGSFTITHTLQRVIKLMSVPELLKWTDRTIPIPNKVLNRDENNPMTITVKNTMSDHANWKVTATLKDTDQSDKLYSLIWKEDDNVSDAEAKDLVDTKMLLTNQSAIPNANQTYLYEKTWGADAGILLKTKDYVPIGEYKDLTIHWTLENVAGNE